VPDVVGTGLDEPSLVGENHDLGPVPETKFGEDGQCHQDTATIVLPRACPSA